MARWMCWVMRKDGDVGGVKVPAWRDGCVG